MATYRIPEGELSLAHAAKTSGEHFAIRQENSSHGPGALMGLVLLLSARHSIILYITTLLTFVQNLAAKYFWDQVNTSIYTSEKI